MAIKEVHNQPPPPEKSWESRTYMYYSRYPADKTMADRSWHKTLRRIGIYTRLVLVGAIIVLAGGIFPLVVSYELFFKQLLTLTCHQCQIVGAKPYFEFDYVIGTALGILGVIIPILVLYVLIKILRSPSLRHDLFHQTSRRGMRFAQMGDHIIE